MCFFKKRKLKALAKFKIGDCVRFKHRGELTFGWIYEIYVQEGHETVYDIQIGGQCPAILYGFKESDLRLKEPNN